MFRIMFLKIEVKRFKNKYKRNQYKKVYVLELLDLVGVVKLLRGCLFYDVIYDVW